MLSRTNQRKRKNMRLPASNAAIKGSGHTLVIDSTATIRAIIMPYSICLFRCTGDVIGSGTITKEKKITAGSRGTETKVYVMRNENVLAYRLILKPETRKGRHRILK